MMAWEWMLAPVVTAIIAWWLALHHIRFFIYLFWLLSGALGGIFALTLLLAILRIAAFAPHPASATSRWGWLYNAFLTLSDHPLIVLVAAIFIEGYLLYLYYEALVRRDSER